MRALTLGLLACLLALAACKRPSQVSQKEKRERNPDSIVEELIFDYYTSRARINYEDINQDFKANADIRIAHDSVIWVSMRSSTGIEGVRAMITKDSIRIVDRLNKQYHSYGYDDLYKKLNFEFSFDMMQSLITGEVPVDSRIRSRYSSKEDEESVYQSVKSGVEITMYVDRKSKKLNRVTVIDKKTENNMAITYGAFSNPDDDPAQTAPFSVKAVLSYRNKEGSLNTKLDMVTSKITLTERNLRFPFRKPSNFETGDIED